jgi:hypothetical protein
MLAACIALAVAGTVSAASPPSLFEPAAVGDGTIGIFADAAGSEPCSTIPPGTYSTLYIIATLGGATTDGLTGAEFRIEVSNPAGWQMLFNPPPNGTIMIGNPLDLAPDDPNNDIGLNIAFHECQMGPRVPLGTLLVFNQGGQATELRVKRRTPPANSAFPCPLFTRCDPHFTKVCMGACAVSPVGEAVTFTGSINDPTCRSAAACPADCAKVPCVSIASVPLRRACSGTAIPVTGTVTNCGTEPADIDIFIDYVLAASHTAVPPGGVVTAKRSVVQDCSPNYDLQFVGVVARSATCPQPVGAENVQLVVCDARTCGGNEPPNCSAARASVPVLWPANDQFIPVAIEGVTDLNGDPVQVRVTRVTTDEYNPDPYECDAEHTPDGLQLRAAHDAMGNGRVYTVSFEATEPSGLNCRGQAIVCVPKSSQQACVDDGQTHELYPTCGVPLSEPGGLTALPVAGAGVRITLAKPIVRAARIEIYDARGRRIAALDDKRLPPGTTDVLWDGRDSGGRVAARGVYLIRALVDGESRTAKSVLLR